MAAPKRSELIAGATQIKVETVPEANSAPRVGGYLEQLARSIPKQWEPTETYEANEFCFFNDAAYRAREFCDVGESPAEAPDKWRSRQVNDQDLQSVTERDNQTSVNIKANGGVSANDWRRAMGMPTEVFVADYDEENGLCLALVDVATLLGAAVKPALVLGTLPVLDFTVGVAVDYTFPAGVVTAPDGAVVTYRPDGPGPAGLAGDTTRHITGSPTTAATAFEWPWVASASGRADLRFKLTGSVRPAGQNVSIDKSYAGTNPERSLSLFAWGSVPTGGNMRATLTGISGTSYGPVTLMADKTGYNRPPYFNDKAPFAWLFREVSSSVDQRPPVGTYSILIEALDQNGTVLLTRNDTFSQTSQGIERQIYPDGGTVNLPPQYNNNLAASATVSTGTPLRFKPSNYFNDPEGDSLTFGVMGETTVSYTTESGTGDILVNAPNTGRIGFYCTDAQQRQAFTGFCQITTVAPAFSIERADFRIVQGSSGYYLAEYRFKFVNLPSGGYVLNTAFQGSSPGNPAVGRTDYYNQPTDWYTHNATVTLSTTATQGSSWTVSLVAGGISVQLNVISVSTLTTNPTFATIIGGTTTPPTTGDTLTETKAYMAKPVPGFVNYAVATDAGGTTVSDLERGDRRNGELKRNWGDGHPLGRGAMNPTKVAKRGGLVYFQSKTWANDSTERWNGSGLDPMTLVHGLLLVPGPMHSPNTLPAPSNYTPGRTSWLDQIADFPEMAPIAGKTLATYCRVDANTPQTYLNRGFTKLYRAQFWTNAGYLDTHPHERHNTVGVIYSDQHETVFAALSFQQVADYVATYIGELGMFWLDFEHENKWGGEFYYGPQGTWKNMYALFAFCEALYPDGIRGNMYQVGYWSNTFSKEANVQPMHNQFIQAYQSNPFSQNSWGTFDFPGCTVNLNGNTINVPAANGVSILSKQNALIINGYLPGWNDEAAIRQFQLYNAYSLIHDAQVIRKWYPNHKLISYNWTQTDRDGPGMLWINTPTGQIGYMVNTWITGWMAQYVEATGLLFGDGNYHWHDDQPFIGDANKPAGAANWLVTRQWIPNVPGTPAPWESGGSYTNGYPRMPQWLLTEALQITRQLKDCESIWNTSQSVRSVADYSLDGGATWITDLTPPTTATSDRLAAYNALTTPQKREISILVKAQDKRVIVYKWEHPTNGKLIYAHNPFGAFGETNLLARFSDGSTKPIKLLGAYPSIVPFNPDGSFKYAN